MREESVMNIGKNLERLSRKSSKIRRDLRLRNASIGSLRPEDIVQDFETDAHFDDGLEHFLKMPLTERGPGRKSKFLNRRKSQIRFRRDKTPGGKHSLARSKSRSQQNLAKSAKKGQSSAFKSAKKSRSRSRSDFKKFKTPRGLTSMTSRKFSQPIKNFTKSPGRSAAKKSALKKKTPKMATNTQEDDGDVSTISIYEKKREQIDKSKKISKK